MTSSNPGLCADCRWARVVESGRGSRFLRCGRSDFDPVFPRYPRLPVIVCAGYERIEAATPAPRDTE